MMKKIVLTSVFLVLLAAVLLITLSCREKPVTKKEAAGTEHYTPFLRKGNPIGCLHFDEPSFQNAVSSAVLYREDTEGLKGGIVPHHLLASNMIASFWKTTSLQSYDLIVIIGPDHEKRGKTDISTASAGFSTLYGDVDADKGLVDALIQDNVVGEDTFVMEKDHAVSSHMPFIRYYMPGTPVLPLLVKGNCDTGKISLLSSKITEYTKDRKVLFVASMDFSHYLPLEEANRMDTITENTLVDFDFERIPSLTNDHLDSRPSALFLLHTMSNLGARSPEKWEHSNSDIISNTITGYTTSYFTFGFFQNAERVNEPPGEKLRIMAVGDIMLGRGVASGLTAIQTGYRYPFLETVDLLNRGDIVFGNLEHPITNREKSLDANGKIILRAGPEIMTGLELAGFNLLSLANNHIMDYYGDGLTDTLSLLEKYNIGFAGAGKNLEEARKPAIVKKNGLKAGLLAYTDMAGTEYGGNPPIRFAADSGTPGVAPINPRIMEEDIKKAREQVDLLLVSLHWGIEDSYAITDEQMQFAHWLIDRGADMVLGHHPHRFQGIELYQGKPIVYSLGNFIFDQAHPESRESFILEITYTGTVLESMKAIPVRIENKTQVVPQKKTDAQEMMERLIGLSADLGTSCGIAEGCVVFQVSVEESLSAESTDP